MNRTKVMSGVLASILLMLSACGSDDESLDNIVKFEGGQFRLYKGYQYKSSEITGTGSTSFYVMFLGDGVSYDKSTDKFSGIGSLISFSMYSGNEAEISQGEYTVDIFSYDSIGYADDCEIYYNYDFSQDTGVYYNVNAGIFNVENLGSAMKYNIDLVADTVYFTGNYKGPISTL